jgi:tetratricopeptide (TPR) repeat protein
LAKAKEETEKKLAEASHALENLNKQFPEEQIETARQALSRGDTKAAAVLFQQVLQKGQDQAAQAAFNLGLLAEARIDYAGARRYYEAAARLQPNNSIYLNAVGSILLDLGKYLGKYNEAETLFSEPRRFREGIGTGAP